MFFLLSFLFYISQNTDLTPKKLNFDDVVTIYTDNFTLNTWPRYAIKYGKIIQIGFGGNVLATNKDYFHISSEYTPKDIVYIPNFGASFINPEDNDGGGYASTGEVFTHIVYICK